ncbi:MAG: endonuclease/exonuclease/phosphatase family metal-dependent hydrolase [Myxococcota bacterium]|jgi:endonuclease/exonuclease/phosphatase family metal-dependent hydrolase
MLTIATFNVHGATSEHQALIELLVDLDVDILCLQECPEDTALTIQATLGGSWEVAWAPAAYLGNALLTRLPMVDVTLLSLSATFTEDRSAVVADLQWKGETVQVCCTHLDHVSADNRLEQWESLTEQVDLTAGVLCGDLNALTRADYRDPAWEEIAAVREQSAWEPPVSTLMDAIEAEGFADAAEGYDILGTSRFGTRIDYVLLGADCTLTVVGYDTVDVGGISDHSVVVVELRG